MTDLPKSGNSSTESYARLRHRVERQDKQLLVLRAALERLELLDGKGPDCERARKIASRALDAEVRIRTES